MRYCHFQKLCVCCITLVGEVAIPFGIICNSRSHFKETGFGICAHCDGSLRAQSQGAHVVHSVHCSRSSLEAVYLKKTRQNVSSSDEIFKFKSLPTSFRCLLSFVDFFCSLLSACFLLSFVAWVLFHSLSSFSLQCREFFFFSSFLLASMLKLPTSSLPAC
jgi:hypothetical protein